MESNLSNNLLWEKYRPRTLEDLVLPDRILNEFINGDVKQHYIFYGHYGTGKTSLARILMGKYEENRSYLEINCSYDTSIDILRTQIDDFCRFQPMFDTSNDIKIVVLDEFERVSANFQDAFKAFVEKYNKNVRFILTTNHYNKIGGGMLSRFKSINFDSHNKEEILDLKKKMMVKISKQILPAENIEIDRKVLAGIINNSFPDFRKTISSLQSYKDSGGSTVEAAISEDIIKKLYSIVLSKNIDFNASYHFLMDKITADRIGILFDLLGTKLIKFINENNIKVSDEGLFGIPVIICDLQPKLESSIDPIILGLNLIRQIQLNIYSHEN